MVCFPCCIFLRLRRWRGHRSIRIHEIRPSEALPPTSIKIGLNYTIVAPPGFHNTTISNKYPYMVCRAVFVQFKTEIPRL